MLRKRRKSDTYVPPPHELVDKDYIIATDPYDPISCCCCGDPLRGLTEQRHMLLGLYRCKGWCGRCRAWRMSELYELGERDERLSEPG